MRSFLQPLSSTSCVSCLPKEYRPNITPSVSRGILCRCGYSFASKKAFHGFPEIDATRVEHKAEPEKNNPDIVFWLGSRRRQFFGMYIIESSLELAEREIWIDFFMGFVALEIGHCGNSMQFIWPNSVIWSTSRRNL